MHPGTVFVATAGTPILQFSSLWSHSASELMEQELELISDGNVPGTDVSWFCENLNWKLLLTYIWTHDSLKVIISSVANLKANL